MKYLKKFENHSQYESYINGGGVALPNVSLCVQENEVYYNPLVISHNNIITYMASAKLAETTSNKTSGLHTNAFNTTIVSHTFENGVGTIEFEEDVTSIGNYAFYGCRSLTIVTIPNSVTSIGNYTFQSCSNLTSVTIPNGVTSIGDLAFAGCSSLTNVTIPNSVTIIGANAFDSCSLSSVTIPNSVTIIASEAFSNCSGLNNIISLATTAPTIQRSTFQSIKPNGTLYVPQGSSGYDAWMGTSSYYLGYYNWTKVEQ